MFCHLSRPIQLVIWTGFIVVWLVQISLPSSVRAGDFSPDAIEEATATMLSASNEWAILINTPIEELLGMVVTTASRRSEKLWQTAAATFVITSEDIQRSAATNVVDLLRTVPGLFVGNLNSNFTVFGTRGVAYELLVDFLVLIDGRQVNFMHWGGLFWDVQDYPLDDIERIEIILGPGGTLWGTNSGNGVINIITKHAQDTQGGLLSGIAGTDLYKGTVRYGGKMGEDGYYRVYGLYKDVDDFNNAQSNESVDDWDLSKGGFRLDWQPSDWDEITFQGDAYQSDAWLPHYIDFIPPDFYIPGQTRYLREKNGMDLLLDWKHTFEDDSQMKWLTYYDFFELNQIDFTYLKYHTLKTDFQYQFSPFSRHDIVVGAGYRLITDDTSIGVFEYNPLSANDQTFTVFAQDTITLIEDELKLSLGSQFQWSDIAGLDWQPSAKLVYTPYDKYTLWASVSHAAQVYYRAFEDIRMPVTSPEYPNFGDPPLVVYHNWGNDLCSEKILSFELGQRLQVAQRLSFELSAFYYEKDDMLSFDIHPDQVYLLREPFLHYRLYATNGNSVYGETYGAELAMNAQVTDYWKLKMSYSASDAQLHLRPGSLDTFYSGMEDIFPHHQMKMQSYLGISRNLKFDVFYYFVDEMNRDPLHISPHSRLDVRLAWSPNEKLDLSVVGTNLLDDQTNEILGQFSAPTEVERGVYAQLTYRF